MPCPRRSVPWKWSLVQFNRARLTDARDSAHAAQWHTAIEHRSTQVGHDHCSPGTDRQVTPNTANQDLIPPVVHGLSAAGCTDQCARWVQVWHPRCTQLIALLDQVADDLNGLSIQPGDDLSRCRRRLWIQMDACLQQYQRLLQIQRHALVTGIKGGHLSPLALCRLSHHQSRFLPRLPAARERLAPSVAWWRPGAPWTTAELPPDLLANTEMAADLPGHACAWSAQILACGQAASSVRRLARRVERLLGMYTHAVQATGG